VAGVVNTIVDPVVWMWCTCISVGHVCNGVLDYDIVRSGTWERVICTGFDIAALTLANLTFHVFSPSPSQQENSTIIQGHYSIC
jgi:hypothetical protein